MMQVVLSPKASQTMENYFENYVGSQNRNDITQRAYHYSRILKCLSQINCFDTYIVNEKNFVDIDDICRVEYKIENNNTEVVIKDVHFNNDDGIDEDIDPIFDFMNKLSNVTI